MGYRIAIRRYSQPWIFSTVQRRFVSKATRKAALALTLAFALAGAVYAQGAAPFARLAGAWSGSGTIDLANGTHEQIKCRASYDVLEQQHNLQLNIRCASESYNFDLRGSATDNAGKITGSWSEATRNAAGTLAGKVDDSHFQVVAKGPSFTATLTLVTRGDKQTVAIKSQDAKASVKGASINLTRS
jgi:hypothetical protein